MYTKQLLSIASLAIASSLVFTSAQAANDAGNPLHPAYFSIKSAGKDTAGGGERYVDTSNPLNPGYYVKGGWTSTGATQPYVNSTNPLHPAYKRF